MFARRMVFKILAGIGGFVVAPFGKRGLCDCQTSATYFFSHSESRSATTRRVWSVMHAIWNLAFRDDRIQ